MNKLVVLFILTFIYGNLYAQDISQNNVPAVILNTFQVRFPNAENIKWRLEKGRYRVEYKVNNKSHKLFINNTGQVVKHMQDLYVSEIPKSVLETIRSKQPYFDVHDADRYENKGTITYEISFKIDGKNRVFWTNGVGKLIKYRKELKDNEVPLSIMNIISSRYGSLDIQKAKYVEDREKHIYIIKGEINKMYHAFTFDSKPTLIFHSQDLRSSEIPKSILTTIKKEYVNYEIKDADLVEKQEKTSYKLILKKSKKKIKVIFSPTGDILKVKDK